MSNEGNQKRHVKRLEDLITSYVEVRDYCLEKKVKFNKSEFRNVAILVLSNDINEIAKSIKSLFKNQLFTGIDSLNRVAFEKFIYLKHVIKNEDRAKAFYLKQQLRQIEHVDRLLNVQEYQKSFMSMIGEDIEPIKERIRTRVIDFNDRKKEIIENYRSCFSYPIDDNHIHRHKWYNYSENANNLRKLANEIDLLDEFDVMYDILSSEVHSFSLPDIYRVFKEDDIAYFGIMNEVSEDRKLDGVIIIASRLFRVIQLMFVFYEVPKHMINSFHELIKQTIDYKEHIKK